MQSNKWDQKPQTVVDHRDSVKVELDPRLIALLLGRHVGMIRYHTIGIYGILHKYSCWTTTVQLLLSCHFGYYLPMLNEHDDDDANTDMIPTYPSPTAEDQSDVVTKWLDTIVLYIKKRRERLSIFIIRIILALLLSINWIKYTRVLTVPFGLCQTSFSSKHLILNFLLFRLFFDPFLLFNLHITYPFISLHSSVKDSV